MNRLFYGILFVLTAYTPLFASTPLITVSPDHITQGDPCMVTIHFGTTTPPDVTTLLFDTQKINVFIYHQTPIAFIGVDLNAKVGEHVLTVTVSNGETFKQNVTIEKRNKEEAPLGIPEKLGGNTKASQKKLTANLHKENDILSALLTGKKVLWSEPFIFPVMNPIVVDTYGYSRKTGEYTIAHKGTDFRAKTGTKVYAMNRGVVRVAKKSKIYGNMIVIDHGLGLMTFYMHLSKLQVKERQIVERGSVIGLSGQTGYALGPHLHLTVRLNNTSIDPIKFLNFF